MIIERALKCDHIFEWNVCRKCRIHARNADGSGKLQNEWEELEAEQGWDGVRKRAIKESTHRNNFILLDADMKWTGIWLNQACFYSLKYTRVARTGLAARFMWDYPFTFHGKPNPEYDDDDEPGYAFTGFDNSDYADKEWARTWFEWLAKRSAYRDVIITKNWAEARYEGVLYDTTFPVEVVLSAACGVRYIDENPAIPKTWFALQKYCGNGLALLGAHYGLYEGKGQMGSRKFVGGHSMFNVNSLSLSGRENLINQKLSPQFTKPMYDKLIWAQFVTIWNGADIYSYKDRKKSEIKVPLYGKVWTPDYFDNPYQSAQYVGIKKWLDDFRKENSI